MPLRIGLVASTGTEGYNDFVGQFRGSGLAFSVVLFRASVQGPGAPASVARALRAAAQSGCDLVVMVRGGGSRGDLAAFDSELVARAVATSPRPVWTGIGHTGDQSVADIVANHAFVTPTECGQEVVARVRAWWEAAAASAARIARSAAATIAAASLRHATARLRLGSATRGQLHRHSHRLQGHVAAVATHSRRRIEDAALTLDRSATRLGVCGRTALDRQHDKVAAWRRLLAAYDVERQLERGYTITMRPDGAVIRSSADVVAGDRLVTRFADGRARSSVDEVEAADRSGGNR